MPQLRFYPALDISGGEPDLVLAALDDFSPTAIEERDDILRAFFTDTETRDAARRALMRAYTVDAVEVSDEDWARRSQGNLPPITVGRITVVANPQSASAACASGIRNSESAIDSVHPLVLVIEPSMGFGTGHHATTRLCLDALQHIEVAGKRVLDVGTGSGVLAIAAARLGATSAEGIDVDADAIQSALANLALNPGARGVALRVADLADPGLAPADVVVANLTGALLVRAASTLRATVASNGVLIVSGLQSHERDDVTAALEPAKILWQREEDSWVGIAMRKL